MHTFWIIKYFSEIALFLKWIVLTRYPLLSFDTSAIPHPISFSTSCFLQDFLLVAIVFWPWFYWHPELTWCCADLIHWTLTLHNSNFAQSGEIRGVLLFHCHLWTVRGNSCGRWNTLYGKNVLSILSCFIFSFLTNLFSKQALFSECSYQLMYDKYIKDRKSKMCEM